MTSHDSQTLEGVIEKRERHERLILVLGYLAIIAIVASIFLLFAC